MKTTIFGLAFATAVTLVAHGQTARFLGDGTLVISDGKHRIHLANTSEPRDNIPMAPCVYAIQKRGGEYFVVVTTSSWSRGSFSPKGFGGSGVESNIEWLHLDAAGKILEDREFLYDSWRRNRSGGIAGWHGPILSGDTDAEIPERVEAHLKDSWENIKFAYDIRHPEKGISEEHSTPHEP